MRRRQPPLALRLPAAAFEGLGLLAKSAAKLDAIRTAVEGADQLFNLDAIEDRVANSIAVPKSQASEILQALLNLHALRVRLEVAPQELVAAVEQAIADSDRSDKDTLLREWREAASVIQQTLHPGDPVALLQKAVHLAYAHGNVMERARLLTNIRPVFDADAAKLKGTVVTHTLDLEFYDGAHYQTVQLAVDAADIANLKRSCDRALKKIEAVQKAFATCDWVMFVPGGDADE